MLLFVFHPIPLFSFYCMPMENMVPVISDFIPCIHCGDIGRVFNMKKGLSDYKLRIWLYVSVESDVAWDILSNTKWSCLQKKWECLGI